MNQILGRLQAELVKVVGDLDKDQTQWRPRARPEAWSIQQIVEHLRLSYGTTVRVMEARLEKRAPTKGRASFRQRVGQIMVVGLGYLPKGREAPDVVMPRATVYALSGSELCRSVGEGLARMDVALDECERAFGKGRSVTHVVLGPMSLGQWRRFHLVHGRHHFKQIAAIRKEYGV